MSRYGKSADSSRIAVCCGVPVLSWWTAWKLVAARYGCRCSNIFFSRTVTHHALLADAQRQHYRSHLRNWNRRVQAGSFAFTLKCRPNCVTPVNRNDCSPVSSANTIFPKSGHSREWEWVQSNSCWEGCCSVEHSLYLITTTLIPRHPMTSRVQ